MIRSSMRQIVRCALATLVLTLALGYSATAAAQVGTTTDLIIGRITGPDSVALRGAHVDATSLESGITRSKVTDDAGRFSIVFPDGGGRYVLTVHYLGMAPVRALLQRVADEDRLVANIQLAASPVLLSKVQVEGDRASDTLAAGAGSLGSVLSRELLDRLGYVGNDAMAIALLTPGVTLMAGADSSMSQISIGGQAPSQTAHLVDGSAAGGAQLPREAVKNTNVATSAYDVSIGQYSGGYVDQSSVSGTNRVQGSLSSNLAAPSLALAQTAPGLIDRDAQALTWAAISPDRCGRTGSSPLEHSTPDARRCHRCRRTSAADATLERMGVAPDSLAHFVDILDSNGIARPADPTRIRLYGNQSLFGRLDYTPSERYTLTVSANSYHFWSDGFTSGPLSTPTSGAEFSSQFVRGFAALTAHLDAIRQ